MLIAISNYLLICLHMFLSYYIYLYVYVPSVYLYVYLSIPTSCDYFLLLLADFSTSSVNQYIHMHFFFLNALYRHLRFS